MTVLRKRVVSLLLVLCMTLTLLFALQLSVIGAEEATAEVTTEEITPVEGEEAAEEAEEAPVAPPQAAAFSDIEGHWAAKQITAAADMSLVNGMGDGTYAPEGTVTRAQFVQMMVNLLGETEAGTGCPYTDIVGEESNPWYYTAVSKAWELELIVFADGETFLPEQAITREEMATLLSKALQSKGLVADDSFAIDQVVSDSADITEAYLADAKFVVFHEIMNGMEDGKFYPQGETTRAQAATVLVRAYYAMADNEMSDGEEIEK